MPDGPATIGEVARRLDRLDASLDRVGTRVMGELHGIRSEFVLAQVHERDVKALRDDLHDLSDDVETLIVTRRQLYIGAAVIVIGEILAILIALSNLAARTANIVP